ncbi:MAG: Asp-tRNA(Asn)/Glu-tRNA(Gln) amidotransferase subunit GatB [Dehalococcoidales bacterium]|nr:Asp-tRNA(Asn)/Glu-tRNA(Gln) amidotransferase subunit GatB [Dehalococcoidales bacterium]
MTDNLSKYEIVIGLEVHAQLLTESKMFCPCSAHYAAAPANTYVCPICLGMPGALPVINQKAVEYTIMTGLALNCEIPTFTKFDRKNYHYPDLMKGYQISQYDHPLCKNGSLEVEVEGDLRRVGITRVHLEEDTARLLHVTEAADGAHSLVDVNRSGVPLMEIVSEPDIRSPEEARLYLVKLRQILRYLGISTGNMEEGSFRCDANISLRPWGTTAFGGKVEIKNMNSFRSVFRALEFEAQRQADVLAAGGKIDQETRGWVDARGVTVSQRSKEYAHDYRYFPEPDLPPLEITRDKVEELRRQLPELPDAKEERFQSEFGLPAYDAGLLTASRETAEYYERAVALHPNPKVVSNWLLGELFRLLNAANAEIEQSKVTPEHLAGLLQLIDRGEVSQQAAKTVLAEVFATGKNPAEVVAEKGLGQVSDAQALAGIIDEVIAANPQSAADYKSGKKQALGHLVGQVMRATKGSANPGLVNKILAEKLSGD